MLTNSLHPVREASEVKETPEAKLHRLCVLQNQMESDLWTAIDKLSDFGQKHELMLTKLLRRQWVVFAFLGTILLLTTINLWRHW
jgi:hypothetical protein